LQIDPLLKFIAVAGSAHRAAFNKRILWQLLAAGLLAIERLTKQLDGNDLSLNS
jgi:hypothetical protein